MQSVINPFPLLPNLPLPLLGIKADSAIEAKESPAWRWQMMTPAGDKSHPSLAPGTPAAPTISFGDLLEEVGSMGPFQFLSVLLLSLPVLLLASHNLVQNFSAASPEHKCRLSPSTNASVGHPGPLDQSQLPDRCQRFVRRMALDPNGSLDKDRGAEIEPCHDGWLYDNSTFASTIVTEVWTGDHHRPVCPG